MAKLGFVTTILPMALVLLSDSLLANPPATKPVTVTGTLETGLMAIGGETTGTIIKANGRAYELDLGEDAKLREAADTLNGQQVTVTGPLRRVRGTEIKERWIITVQQLSAAQPATEHTPPVRPNFEAKFRKPGTSIRFEELFDDLVIHIRSDTGIDHGTIDRHVEEWPKRIVLRMYLHGLELCEVTAGDLILGWSVSSSDPEKFRAWQKINGQEVPLTQVFPLFAPVVRHGSIPRDKGPGISFRSFPNVEPHLEIELPAGLLAGNPLSIDLQFVDFYR